MFVYHLLRLDRGHTCVTALLMEHPRASLLGPPSLPLPLSLPYRPSIPLFIKTLNIIRNFWYPG